MRDEIKDLLLALFGLGIGLLFIILVWHFCIAHLSLLDIAL
jgi:hypothetical protein